MLPTVVQARISELYSTRLLSAEQDWTTQHVIAKMISAFTYICLYDCFKKANALPAVNLFTIIFHPRLETFYA